MSNTPSNMLALGTKAPDFKLPNPSKNNELQSLESLKGKKGTLVVFMCNHCPFVLHIIDKLEELYEDYKSQGIEFIAINSNDVDRYPADSPELMVDFVDERNIKFPYLFDESQEVAKAYEAACTPDFYLFDNQNKLVYRGQLDDSRPANGIPLSGSDLRSAIDGVVTNRLINPDQKPSIGCNIKWK